MEEIFFKANVWKKSKWGETLIGHIQYLTVLTEIKIQISAVAVKSGQEVCN